MKIFARVSIFSALTGIAWAAALQHGNVAQQLQAELSPLLSHKDLISTEFPARWSDFNAPHPAAVVNVATEADVATTVCT